MNEFDLCTEISLHIRKSYSLLEDNPYGRRTHYLRRPTLPVRYDKKLYGVPSGVGRVDGNQPLFVWSE